jgi:cytochrome P450
MDFKNSLEHVLNNPFQRYAPLGFVFLISVIYYIKNRDPRLRDLPPKVSGWPIINQTFYHLQDDLATNAIKWARQYGEIYRTKSGTTNWIWLNSGEAVKEIIDRRSAIYSSRHPTPMGSDTASGGKRMLFMQYGERWRTLRSIVHRLMTPRMTKSYAPAQLYEAKQLSVDLLDSPEGTTVRSADFRVLYA